MGKSSSSKKKRSKHSSQVGKKKRSTAKKSSSKKLRRRDESVSYSSDDSQSSISMSSSSEDSYRHRKSRSRSYKDAKASRRRDRLRSSSSEEPRHLKKDKRSKTKRNDDSEEKRTFSSKKRKARDASISSRSSGSGDESESERASRSGKHERRDKNKRKSKNIKSEATRERYRSRSCSHCSRDDQSSDLRSQEKVIYVSNSNRLKSVITVVKEDNTETESNGNEDKEEMIFDREDYPSSRSNDSNDGGNKRVSAFQPCVESEKEESINMEKKEDGSASKPSYCKDGIDHDAESRPALDRIRINDTVEEKNRNISEASDNVVTNDLESILRQKALENLKRFRGGNQTNTTAMNSKDENNLILKSVVNSKDDIDVTSKSPTTGRVEVNQIASPKGDGFRVAEADSANSVQNQDKVIIDTKNGSKDSEAADNNSRKSNEKAVSTREKASSNFRRVVNRPRLVTSALKQALSNATSTAKESPPSQESSMSKLLTNSSPGKHNVTPLKSNDNSESASKASHSGSQKISTRLTSARVDVAANKLQDEGRVDLQLEQKPVSSSTTLSSTVDHTTTYASVEPSTCPTSAGTDMTSGKAQDIDKDGSQLQEKTMSVMRGGEMVQVSYKVYVPQKAPALARRKLKR